MLEELVVEEILLQKFVLLLLLQKFVLLLLLQKFVLLLLLQKFVLLLQGAWTLYDSRFLASLLLMMLMILLMMAMLLLPMLPLLVMVQLLVLLLLILQWNHHSFQQHREPETRPSALNYSIPIFPALFFSPQPTRHAPWAQAALLTGTPANVSRTQKCEMY
jgi:hypothetical protein